MDLSLSSPEAARGEEVRARLSAWGGRDRVRAALAADPGFDAELLADLAQRRWFDASGEPGAPSTTQLAVACEALGRLPLPAPVHTALVHPTAVLAGLGRPERATGAAGLTPFTAWCGDAADVGAEPVGAGWRLRGRVPLVPYGTAADALLVPAQAAPGLLVAAVAADRPGIARSLRPTIGQDRATTVVLDDVLVDPVDVVAGPTPVTGDDLAAALDRALVALAADLTGTAASALDLAVERATTRHQWGRPLGSFQALAHRLADVHVAVAGARAAVYDAAGRADLGLPFALEASMAKVAATDAALDATAALHQVHGGEGYYADRDPTLLFRRARALAPRLGGVGHHLARVDALRRARVAGPGAVD